MRAKLRVYYWIYHTAAHDVNTGIQRVVRLLAAGLGSRDDVELVPVCWNEEQQAVVLAESASINRLANYNGPRLPELVTAGEPLHMSSADAGLLTEAWLLIPEVPHVPSIVPAPSLAVVLDYARYYGLRTAHIFYDLIPLRVPGYESMRSDHERYAQALLGFDVIFPISRTSAADLNAWWREQGYDLDHLPRIVPVSLPAEIAGVPRIRQAITDFCPGLRIVAWGTLLPRKNQLALMRAFNRLYRRRRDLELRLDLVGGVEASIADTVRAEEARSDGAIRCLGNLSDAQLWALVSNCTATAFLSVLEGFGLPIAESLWLGRPCLCSNIGSMAEIAEGGGCLTVDPHDEMAIEQALERLATDAELRQRLTVQATTRELTTHAEYAGAICAQLRDVPLVPNLTVIEGARGGGLQFADALTRCGVLVRRVHWRSQTKSILPGFIEDNSDYPPGYGDLRGAWAVMPLSTATDLAEVMRIEDEARGRGASFAVWVDMPHYPENLVVALATADLVLFGYETERANALEKALQRLNRTTTVRHRYRVAKDAKELVANLFSKRSKTSAPSILPQIQRLYYWCGTISTQRFNSGIQRSTRLIASECVKLGIDLIPVKWDDGTARLRMLNEEEAATLALWSGPFPRKPEPLPTNLSGEWLLIYEIPVPLEPEGSNPARLARKLGMRVAAVCYDLVPHKLPTLYDSEFLRLMASYWEMFAEVDVVLPISWTAAGDLRRYMADHGLCARALVPCPLGGNLPDVARARATDIRRSADEPLNLLAVGSLEPRKNYARLIRALMLARRLVGRTSVKLTIVGRHVGYEELEAEIGALAEEAGGVEVLGHVSDEELVVLYRNAQCTVYASWEEGFGLPVLESLWRGKPCLCHDGSAIAEVARGGGTLSVNMLDEEAIARGIAVLAQDVALFERLCGEALTRPIRSWTECAHDVLLAMKRTGAAPGWPLPAVVPLRRHPLLTCAISTYNRARWLSHSLARLVDAAKPWRDSVEIVVCDNASSDETPEVLNRFKGTRSFSATRNVVNVGVLGNMAVTARASSGSYVWILDDDDLIVDGAIENVVTGLDRHRDVEMAYLNYACTDFDQPEPTTNPAKIIEAATMIGYGGPNRRVDELREVAGLNESLFTEISACVFRADHAKRAYQQDVRGGPWSSLLTCVPSAVYALSALADRPAWWVGEPAVVVNMDASWFRRVLLWYLERVQDLFDLSEMAGIDSARIDRYRQHHVRHAGTWVRQALFAAEDDVRTRISVDRFLERTKHVAAVRPEIPLMYSAYADAWDAGCVVADTFPPDELFARHGLLKEAKHPKQINGSEKVAGTIDALYRVILGREPDEDGNRVFTTLLLSGESPERLARILARSPEFFRRGGISALLSHLSLS